MFEREVLTKLKLWSESSYRKPLILRGARQVGKTTVVNEFSKASIIIFILIWNIRKQISCSIRLYLFLH